MKLFLSILISIIPFFASAQAPSKVVQDTVTYFGSAQELDSVAIFRGEKFGVRRFREGAVDDFVRETGFNYSKEGCTANRLIVLITVDEKGNVVAVDLPNEDANSNCVRKLKEAIYKSSGMWSPAIRKGQKVRSKFGIRI